MRIAWFTPLAARSAIGEFSRHVCERLAGAADVELWVDESFGLQDTAVPVVDYALDPAALDRLPGYDAIVYNFGNEARYHGSMYEVSRSHPGVALLHDRVYQHFLFDYHAQRGGLRAYRDHMRAHYGKAGDDAARADPPVWLDDFASARFPLFEEVIVGARGVVVHSQSHRRLVEQRYLGPIATLFLPAYSLPEVAPPPAAEPDRLLLLTLGLVNRNKHVHAVIEALARDPDLAARVRYVVAGPEEAGSPYRLELRERIERAGLHDTVVLAGYQSEEALEALIAEAAIFVNLRWPSMEGSSASLLRQLPHAKPVVVYSSGVFAELPDDAVVKVPPGAPEQLGPALRALVDDPARRATVGAAGRRLAETYTVERYAEGFLGFLEEVRSWTPVLSLSDRVAQLLHELGADADGPLVRSSSAVLGDVFGL
jgi:glycosyltransferase involved in cell wall biosynthesis